ncbi:MAG: hypothetical protein JRJ03_18810 [Deltaproteobacteria bacterium]|nr:hypothetical protein [Deltaproteobacteria bacterium]
MKWPLAIIYAFGATFILYTGMTRVLRVDLWAGTLPTIIPGIMGGAIIPPL